MSMNPTGSETHVDPRGMTLEEIMAVFAVDFELVKIAEYTSPQPMRLDDLLYEVFGPVRPSLEPFVWADYPDAEWGDDI